MRRGRHDERLHFGIRHDMAFAQRPGGGLGDGKVAVREQSQKIDAWFVRGNSGESVTNQSFVVRQRESDVSGCQRVAFVQRGKRDGTHVGIVAIEGGFECRRVVLVSGKRDGRQRDGDRLHGSAQQVVGRLDQKGDRDGQGEGDDEARGDGEPDEATCCRHAAPCRRWTVDPSGMLVDSQIDGYGTPAASPYLAPVDALAKHGDGKSSGETHDTGAHGDIGR